MNVFINISENTGEPALPTKIKNLLDLGKDFFVPNTIYFPLSTRVDIDNIIKAYEAHIHADYYIVRSAHQNEDGEKKSYAGVYHSKKNSYTRENLKEDIDFVAEFLGKEDFIMIQEYHNADFSGIFFSDVGNGHRYIEYIAGGSENITSGYENGSNLLYNGDHNRLFSHIGFQKKYTSDAGREVIYDGCANIRDNEQKSIMKELSKLCKKIGGDIDVEWIFHKGHLFILQVRTITVDFKKVYLPMNSKELHPEMTPLLEKCGILQDFFEKFGFEKSDIIFDSGGGLFGGGIYGNIQVQEETLKIIYEDKLYILFPESPLSQGLFEENERHELRFREVTLREKFQKYCEKLGLHLFLARLPIDPELSIFCDYGFPGLFFLKNQKTFPELIKEKQGNEGVSLLPISGEIEFGSHQNLEKLDQFSFLVTKDIHIAEDGPHVFVGFDIRDYTLHPNIKLLLLERANHLSHGAILAREIGIPCIYGIRGITNTLKNGQRIEILTREQKIQIKKYI